MSAVLCGQRFETQNNQWSLFHEAFMGYVVPMSSFLFLCQDTAKRRDYPIKAFLFLGLSRNASPVSMLARVWVELAVYEGSQMVETL